MAKLTKAQLVKELKKLKVKDIPAGATQPQLEKLLAKVQKAKKDDEKITPEDELADEKVEDTKEAAGDEKVEDKADEEDEDNDENDERITPEDEEDEAPEVADKEKDYLLKYQFGKDDDGPFRRGDPRSNPIKGSKAEIMKAKLLKQKRVTVMIPVPPRESKAYPHSVCINGYRLDLPRGEYLEVPEQVAELIINSQRQQSEALQPMRIDRDEKTTNALS